MGAHLRDYEYIYIFLSGLFIFSCEDYARLWYFHLDIWAKLVLCPQMFNIHIELVEFVHGKHHMHCLNCCHLLCLAVLLTKSKES